MLHDRLQRATELLTLFMLSLWGHWAIYYWVSVLGLNASYSDLKDWLPILAAQVASTMLLFARGDLGLSDSPPPTTSQAGWSQRRLTRRGVVTVALLGIVLVGIALSVGVLGWSRSPIGYNLLWALVTPPAAVAYMYRRPSRRDVEDSATDHGSSNTRALDMIALAGAIVIAVWVFSTFDRTSLDDAFYGHVISSTLAHPDAPVQGRDLLLGTAAPYSLHPGYRVSGYEVLAALISDLTNTDPLWVYRGVFPILGALFWVLVGHMFLRSLPIPYPGLAVLIALLVLVNWRAPRAIGSVFTLLHVGKSQVSAIAAPLLFASIATLARRRGWTSWTMLLLSICAVGAWSSSALFIVPVAVVAAAAVYLPLERRSVADLALIVIALLPLLLAAAVVMHVAAELPPYTAGGDGTGEVLVSGEALGGVWTKSLLLVTLAALPLVMRSGRDTALYHQLVRFSLIGMLTIYAPYWIELVAVQANMFLLSWRMPWAFPNAFIPGILAAVLIARLTTHRETRFKLRMRRHLLVLAAAGAWVATFLVSLPGWVSFSVARKTAETTTRQFDDTLAEARAARAMIPDDAYVAAGHLDAFLPMLPAPPVFVWVRHYLRYHRNLLEPAEWRQRASIHRLTSLLPLGKKWPAARYERHVPLLIARAKDLGVTTMVFRAIPEPGPEAERQIQAWRIEVLTRELSSAGYRCETTSSGKTRVCNLSTSGTSRSSSADAAAIPTGRDLVGGS